MDDGFDNTASMFGNTIGKLVKLGKEVSILWVKTPLLKSLFVRALNS